MAPMRAPVSAIALVIASFGSFVLVAACGSRSPAPAEALVRYMDAVQREDLETLYCLSAGAATAPELGADDAQRRDAFGEWARGQYDVYLDGRDAGIVDLDDEGIRTVKLFALGRGTFFSPGRVTSRNANSATVRTDLTFGYGHVDLSRLSPGTTFYMCTEPVGATIPVEIPRFSKEIRVEVLDQLTLEWNLVLEPAGTACPGGWAVAGVRPVEGAVSTVELTLAF